MTSIEGVDYAWARPRPTELYRLGKRFAVRYLSYGPSGKNLTRTEAEALSAAGINIVCVWEEAATDALKGFTGGQRDAMEAVHLAQDCGAPADVVIYFAVDFDPETAAYSLVRDYFQGVQTVMPVERIGVYGGFRTVDYLWRNGLATYLWQTYAWSTYWLLPDGSWSRTDPNVSGAVKQIRWHPQCAAQQYRNGVLVDGDDCDLDRAVKEFYGQWRIGGMSVWDEPLKPYNGTDMKMGTALALCLARLDYLANKAQIVAKLTEILDAIHAVDQPDSQLPPDYEAALRGIRDELDALPELTATATINKIAD